VAAGGTGGDVLLSPQGLTAAQAAALLDCHQATVSRWINRFNREGSAALADRQRYCSFRQGRRWLTGPG